MAADALVAIAGSLKRRHGGLFWVGANISAHLQFQDAQDPVSESFGLRRATASSTARRRMSTQALEPGSGVGLDLAPAQV